MADDEEAQEKQLFDMLRKGGDDAARVFLNGATKVFNAQGTAGLHQWTTRTFFEMPRDTQLAMLTTFLVPYLESKNATKQ